MRHLRATPVALAFVLFASGCPESRPPTPDAEIMFDAAVPEVDAGPAPGEVSSPCASDLECSAPADVCLDDLFGFVPLPDGYCSAFCASDEECPEGSGCIMGRAGGQCLAYCDPSSAEDQCRSGLGCTPGSPRLPSVCVPGCEDDSDCPTGLSCAVGGGFLGSGQCLDLDAPLGGACTSGTDCPGGSFCATEADSDFPGGFCVVFGCDAAADAGCPDDAHCFPQRGGGVCIDGCTTDTDCRMGYECVEPMGFPGRSICTPTFVPENLGQICSGGRGSCAGGTCLSEAGYGFPDSYCVDTGCDPVAQTGCAGDGVCVNAGDGDTICLDGCTADDECRSAYECRASDADEPTSPTACMPACTDNSQCSAAPMSTGPYECNPGTGFCQPPFDAADLGEPCAGPGECLGGRCLTEADDGWPSGTCTYPGCRLSGTGREALCPTGSTCVDDGAGDPELGVCVDSCAAPSECRTGYECVSGACQPA